jgi:uncharacterized membrane protein
MNDATLDAKPRRAARSSAAAGEDVGRIASIDLLRGLVMVLMALDHTRAVFHASDLSVRDVGEPALFLTRWVTHICAPTFIFLAGLSAYLYGQKIGDRTQLAKFLASRGVFLMLLELSLVHFAWAFSAGHTVFALQVIWAIGASMVALAGLIYLPLPLIGAIALVMIAGHNLTDAVSAGDFGQWAWIWHVLHERGSVYPLPDVRLIVVYPLIPWIGVMAAGYALGPLYRLGAHERARALIGLGCALIALFLALRVSNIYGDPVPWVPQATWWSSALAVLNCEKYPPSLGYLLMTLGPALVLLGLFEGARGRLAQWITVFGRVPFFYYVIHLLWIGLLALILTVLTGGGLDSASLRGGGKFSVGLPGVYLLWVFVVATLYPVCAWFAHLKSSQPGWWWRYL